MKVLLFLFVCCSLFAAPRPDREGSRLPETQKKFSEQLSLNKRKIFCGRFNHKQREMAMKYAIGKNKDQCLAPDDAVIRVMEESGMSLAVKSRKECEVR